MSTAGPRTSAMSGSPRSKMVLGFPQYTPNPRQQDTQPNEASGSYQSATAITGQLNLALLGESRSIRQSLSDVLLLELEKIRQQFVNAPAGGRLRQSYPRLRAYRKYKVCRP
jgi:hypothetical protein